MDWDPISWLKSALGDVTGPLGKIEKWTLKQIAKAAALVENDDHKLSDYVDAHVGGIENTISHLAGQINNLAAGVGGDVAGAFDATRHEIVSLIDDALHPIESEVDALKRDVPGWAKDAEHYADDALKAFERDVLDPALKELRTAIHTAESDAEHAWHVWYKDIWAPALHDLRRGRPGLRLGGRFRAGGHERRCRPARSEPGPANNGAQSERYRESQRRHGHEAGRRSRHVHHVLARRQHADERLPEGRTGDHTPASAWNRARV